MQDTANRSAFCRAARLHPDFSRSPRSGDRQRRWWQVFVTNTVRNVGAGKDYRFHDHGTHDLKGFEEPARLCEVAWTEAD